MLHIIDLDIRNEMKNEEFVSECIIKHSTIQVGFYLDIIL